MGHKINDDGSSDLLQWKDDPERAAMARLIREHLDKIKKERENSNVNELDKS
jgi:hypothetical protein